MLIRNGNLYLEISEYDFERYAEDGFEEVKKAKPIKEETKELKAKK